MVPSSKKNHKHGKPERLSFHPHIPVMVLCYHFLPFWWNQNAIELVGPHEKHLLGNISDVLCMLSVLAFVLDVHWLICVGIQHLFFWWMLPYPKASLLSHLIILKKGISGECSNWSANDELAVRFWLRSWSISKLILGCPKFWNLMNLWSLLVITVHEF